MILPRPVEAVMLDMDGLLIDSERAYHDTHIAVAAQLGCVMTSPMFHRLIGVPASDGERLLREMFGEDFDCDALDRGVDVLMDGRDIPLKPGVVELFDVLEATGLRFALVTSSRRATVDKRLGPNGLLDRFQALVTGGEASRGKPHPEPFLLAAERLKVDPAHCLALEDSFNGVRSAHAAGMMAVMVPDLLQATDEIRGLCTHVAGDLHEVCAFLTAKTV